MVDYKIAARYLFSIPGLMAPLLLSVENGWRCACSVLCSATVGFKPAIPSSFAASTVFVGQNEMSRTSRH